MCNILSYLLYTSGVSIAFKMVAVTVNLRNLLFVYNWFTTVRLDTPRPCEQVVCDFPLGTYPIVQMIYLCQLGADLPQY